MGADTCAKILSRTNYLASKDIASRYSSTLVYKALTFSISLTRLPENKSFKTSLNFSVKPIVQYVAAAVFLRYQHWWQTCW